jgi:uncharacterized protein (TIGR02145 family)
MKRRLLFLLPAVLFIAGIFIFSGCNKKNDEPVTVTDIDGNVYDIVKIGDQEWLGSNLNVIHYRNGDPIHQGLTTANKQGAYMNYSNEPGVSDTYGRLYNSFAGRDPRGVCPVGWRVATKDEWEELIDFLGGADVAGGKLKEVGLDHWLDPNTGATDEYGFSALPGGYGGSIGVWMGNYASFWTTTRVYGEDNDETYMYWVYYNNATIARDSDYGASGYSIRCIRE